MRLYSTRLQARAGSLLLPGVLRARGGRRRGSLGGESSGFGDTRLGRRLVGTEERGEEDDHLAAAAAAAVEQWERKDHTALPKAHRTARSLRKHVLTTENDPKQQSITQQQQQADDNDETTTKYDSNLGLHYRSIANSEELPHIPVLLSETLHFLKPIAEGRFLDLTLGAGSFTKAILDQKAKEVIGLDRDELAIEVSKNRLAQEFQRGQFIPVQGRFSDLLSHQFRQRNYPHFDKKFDGVVLDLGVSSMQLDTPERGFSFRYDAPLDMRMDPQSAKSGPMAKDIVNFVSETELQRILQEYGGEEKAGLIARAIVRARRKGMINTTQELAAVVHGALRTEIRNGINSATKTFQALRIYVNDEENELKSALVASKYLLKPEGRMVVLSYHGLEDELVKRFFRDGESGLNLKKKWTESENEEVTRGMKESQFEVVNKHVIMPGINEITSNNRSRSARLRAGILISTLSSQ